METQNTNQETNLNPVPVAGDVNKVDKGTHVIERVRFTKGEKEGFSYNTITYKDYDFLLGKLGKGDVEKGKEIMLILANRQIDAGLKNRAGARHPSNEDFIEDAKGTIAEKRNRAILAAKEKGEIPYDQGGTVLVTEEEAENFIPGSREKTSIIALFKEVQEHQKAGNFQEAIEVMEQIKKLMAAQESNLESQISSLQPTA